MRKKSVKLIILAKALALCFCTNAVAQSYSGGSGTVANPFIVANKTDLKYLSENSGEWSKHFKQTVDINFVASDFSAGGPFYNNNAGFRPIGSNVINFTGSYNGDNHVINNLTINRSTTDYIGLFGYANSAAFEGISLENASIKGEDYTGGIVGYNKSSTSMKNLSVKGSIEGSGYTGGIIGHNENSIVSNCQSVITLKGAIYFGGLIGLNYLNSTVQNCYSTNTITGGSYVGGLVGHNYTNSKIINSYSKSTITGGHHIGGLIGFNEINSSIEDCFSVSNIQGDYHLGGLVGRNRFGSVIKRCCADVTLVGDLEMGGLVGSNQDNSMIENCNSSGSLAGKGYLGGIAGRHEYGSTVSKSHSSCNISASDYFNGGLIGISQESSVSESSANGKVDGLSYVGGLIGYDFKGTISLSYANGNVTGGTGGDFTGGLIGFSGSTNLKKCFATGNVKGGRFYAGGLVGGVSGVTSIIDECHSVGLVTPGTGIPGVVLDGGLIGVNSGGTVTNSYWNTQTSNQSGSAGGTGVLTSDMQTQSTFLGWDFVNTWAIPAGSNYPILSAVCGTCVSCSKIKIFTQPSNVTVCNGATATLTVSASSANGTLSYQWNKNETNVGTNSPILTISNASAANAGTYTVVVSDGSNSITSNPAVLIVNPSPAAPLVTSPLQLLTGSLATPLTATGSNLLWYPSLASISGSPIAPTPNTAIQNTTSYFVTQMVNGCESPKVEIIVKVQDITNPGCISAGGTYTFTLSPQYTANATNYSWWPSSVSTQITGGNTPSATIVASSFFQTGDQVCVGINYNQAPWWRQVCIPVTKCPANPNGGSINTNPNADFPLSPTCMEQNGTYQFTLNSIHTANAVNYNWWGSGISAHNTTVPTNTVSTDNFFSGGQICVGITYNQAPWNKQVCVNVPLCIPVARLGQFELTEEMEKTSVWVSENPVTDRFNVMINSRNESNCKLILTDMNGSVVMETSVLSGMEYGFGEDLASGTYILKVSNDNDSHIETLKLVKY